MGLKSSNLQRSADPSRGDKATVLEENSSDVAPPGRKARPRVIAETATPKPAPTAADDVETLYRERRSLLLYVASRKFRIPESDAENLVQEVFLSYLQTGTKIDNVRAWLVAAMCNASRHYWRARGRTESLPENFGEHADTRSLGLADQFALKMTIRQAVQYLPERCQETLRLHYFEGHSASEVARLLETTSRYAEKMIHNCLNRVREVYRKISAVSR
jgi:RNA polymerase sigma factor (sigma-70 family)